MKSEEEIKENLNEILNPEYNTKLDEYMKGYVSALFWVLK